MRRVIQSVLAALLTAAAVGAAMSGRDVLDRIRRTYDRMDTFQANFEQTFVWKLAGSRQEMRGRFYMKKPSSFRIQTDVQTVVTDGRIVWSYSPATMQVIINDYDPDTMPLRPDNFLFRFPDDRRATHVRTETIGDTDYHVVDVAPKDSTLGIDAMRVWVDDDRWLARKVEYVSISDDTTRYVLNRVRMNPSLPDSTFSFTIPPGTDVVDFRASAIR